MDQTGLVSIDIALAGFRCLAICMVMPLAWWHYAIIGLIEI